MKSCFNTCRVLVLLVFYGGLVCQITAQTFKTLHSFNANDGANPFAGLILSGDTLYGTTVSGGNPGLGMVFAVNTDGTGFRTVHDFPDWRWLYYTNHDGAHPFAGLTLSGDTLFGTTKDGGRLTNGTVFAVKTDGTGFEVLHTFNSSSDGGNPTAKLMLSGNTLYGTAASGGSYGDGTLFAIRTDGSRFTVLHAFNAGSIDPSGVYTNHDGANPSGGLTLSGDTLYGAAPYGGASGNGTLFTAKTDGTGFKLLHTFNASSDGASPLERMALSGNTLYGTAAFGGSYNNGTIFAIQTDGTGFRSLHHFTTTPHPNYTNSDGAGPQSELIISGNTMFGSARLGGGSSSGSVFAINIDGTDFTTLHNFTAPVSFPRTNIDGYSPSGELVLSGDALYGTARSGGSYAGYGDPGGNGTIFRISLPVRPPRLTVIASGDNLILAWQTNYAGFDYGGYILQSTTNLASPVWTTNLPAHVAVNGQYVVTNPISGNQQYFRLRQ